MILRNKPYIFCRSLFGLLLVIATTSCVNTKQSRYFDGQTDAVVETTIVSPEFIISPNHILGITVSSLNPTATDIFNKAISTSQSGNGYLVNREGYIQFPVLGNLRAEGLTGNELRLQIVKALLDRKLLVDPIVTVRLLNFKVTVLGEVGRPSVIDVPNEKISLLEALGLAGDITIYGKRNNVMVIREERDTKIIKRLNLNTSELFNSPYYYLKANDVVYVEPNKAKVSSATRTSQLTPIILTGLSFIAILADRLLR